MAYDVWIIRPQMNIDDVKMRGKGMSPAQLKGIKKELLTLHCLKMMATNIYRYQISRAQNEHDHYLIAAMANEMVHYQDYQVKLFEYGFRLSILRWMYWLVGFILGFSSRLRGRRSSKQASGSKLRRSGIIANFFGR